MTPNKLPPLPEPEFIRPDRPFKIFTADQMRAYGKLCSAEAFQLYVDANEARIDAEHALRQSQSLPAGAVAGLVGKWRDEADRFTHLGDSVDDHESQIWHHGHSERFAYCADELEQALQADAREKGEAWRGELLKLVARVEFEHTDEDGDMDNMLSKDLRRHLRDLRELAADVSPVELPAQDHREAASIDAVVYGTGYLVDGQHVAPSRVEIIRGQSVPIATQPAQASEKDNG